MKWILRLLGFREASEAEQEERDWRQRRKRDHIEALKMKRHSDERVAAGKARVVENLSRKLNKQPYGLWINVVLDDRGWEVQ